MRVVLLAGCPFSRPRYGVSEYVFQLAKALSNMNVETHLVSVSNATTKEFSNAKFHPIPRSPIYYALPPLAVSAIIKRVNAIKPDLVHIHGTTPPYAWAAIALAKKKIPVVATIHGDIQTELNFTKGILRHAWAMFVLIPVYKKLLQHMRKIFVVSRDLQMSLISRGYITHVITSGVNLEEFEYTETLTDEFSYLLYIGRLSKIYGVDILIEALLEVHKRIGKLQSIIAGTGPEGKRLMEIVSSSPLAGTVSFPGFVFGRQKQMLLQNASIVVFSFRQVKGFPIALLEALASGKAIIASKTGGIPEVVVDNENGLLLDEPNPNALAEKIIYLIEHPDIRKRLGKNARNSVQVYSWENIALSYKKEYEKVINGPGAV